MQQIPLRYSMLLLMLNKHATWCFRGPDCSVCVPFGCSQDTLASTGQSSSSSLQGNWRFVLDVSLLAHNLLAGRLAAGFFAFIRDIYAELQHVTLLQVACLP